MKVKSPKLDALYVPHLTTRKSLAAIAPDLAAEWDIERNAPLRPEHVAAHTHQKVWWICGQDPTHRWQAPPHNRVKQRGCPFCLGRLATPTTSFGALHPDLAQEWHPSRNTALQAMAIRPGSKRKVWWQCVKGHEWQAAIYSRVAGNGCPYCANRLVHFDNSLATLFPDVASEWSKTKNGTLSPEAVTAGSNRRVWWQCSRNPLHAWQATVIQRTRIGTGCPHCQSSTSAPELRLFAELKFVFSDAQTRAKIDRQECDVWLPGCRVALEVDGRYWHEEKLDRDLAKNRVLQAAGVLVIRLRERGLKATSSSDVFFDAKTFGLAEVKRVLAQIAGSATLNTTQRAALQNYQGRTAFANESEFLSLLDRLPGPPPEQSLSDLYPAICAEWHAKLNGTLQPDAVAANSNLKVWWQCTKQPTHVWQAAVYSRKSGSGCPYCTGRLVDELNNLAVRNPRLAADWHPTLNGALQPNQTTAVSGKSVWWRCGKNPAHEWRAKISNRANGTGCPICSAKIPSAEENLTVAHPDIAKEWHPSKNLPLTPSSVRSKSAKKVWWQCSRDPSHEWQANISNRTRLGRGCPYCAGQRVTLSSSLASMNPTLAAQWHPTKNQPLSPNDVLPNTHLKVWWQCATDSAHEWQAAVANRNYGTGCPSCYQARRGTERR